VNAVGRNPRATLGRKHPAFMAGLNDEQTPSQGKELSSRMTVLRGPVLRPAPAESERQNRNIAFDEATEFFHVFRSRKHVGAVLTLSR